MCSGRLPRFTVLPLTTPPKTSKGRFAEVAPAVPVPSSGRQVFTYQVPNRENVSVGSSVRIPFGKRQLTGIVTRISSSVPPFPTKPLTALPAPALTEKQLAFGRWLAETMKGGWGYTLRLFLPPQSIKSVTPLSKKWPVSKSKKQKPLQQMISTALKEKGAQILVLVPEKTFLEDWKPWPTLHAALPPKEVAAFWHGVAEGKLRVVVGTQKALFLPFQNLRLIIVEESQLSTHKLWDQYPRLDTRDGAKALAAIHGADLILAGNFPSVETYESTSLPKLQPEVHTFIGSDYKSKNVLPLSLMPVLRSWAQKKHRILLLFNRTGEPVKKLKYSLHRILAKQYEYVTVATSSIFAENPGKFDHVIWLGPELTFSFPDFRSTEEGVIMLARLQQLLPAKERVIAVTRDYALGDFLRNLDLPKVFSEIKAERKKLFLPPFSTIVKLTIRDKNSSKALARATAARKTLVGRLQGTPNIVRGPLKPSTRSKVAEVDLVLFGSLPELTKAYEDLPIDRVDVSPKNLL